jgi:hypothetical protein
MIRFEWTGGVDAANDNNWRPIRTGEIDCPTCSAKAGHNCRGAETVYHDARIVAFMRLKLGVS